MINKILKIILILIIILISIIVTTFSYLLVMTVKLINNSHKINNLKKEYINITEEFNTLRTTYINDLGDDING